MASEEDTEMEDKEASEEEDGSKIVKEGQKKRSRKTKRGSKKAAKDSKTKKKPKSDSSLKERVTPNKRPTRKRKTVERYSDSVTARDCASKPVSIEKGPGTRLKEIPNVDTEMVDKESSEEEDGNKKVKKGQKKRSRKSKEGSKKVAEDSKTRKKAKSDSSLKERVTSNERPIRERKTVERYSDSVTARGSASKPVSIDRGPGTRLKEIPNVAFKLSKKKPDDNLQMLHSILFGKKTKTHSLKKNMGQFSGYVWVQDEQEKQRAKVKERIDRCIKEKLLDFCDVLNIPIIKSHVKKEDLSIKLLEFLESPHATTDILLADKDKKGKKQKVKSTAATKTSSSVEAAAEIPSKKQKRTSQGEKRKRSSKHGEEDKVDHKVEPSSNKDGSEDDEEDSMSEEEEYEPKKPTPSNKSSSKKSIKNDAEGKKVDRSKSLKKGSPVKSSKSTKKSSSPALKKGATDADGASCSTFKSKVPSTKKQKIKKKSKKDQKLSTKGKASSQTKSSAKPSAKDQGKGKIGKKAKAELSKEEMYPVVAAILNEVDFNTVTLNDVLRQLGTHFGVDLTNRKEDVKDVIADVIHNMTDVEDEEEETEAEDDGEKDGSEESDA